MKTSQEITLLSSLALAAAILAALGYPVFVIHNNMTKRLTCDADEHPSLVFPRGAMELPKRRKPAQPQYSATIASHKSSGCRLNREFFMCRIYNDMVETFGRTPLVKLN